MPQVARARDKTKTLKNFFAIIKAKKGLFIGKNTHG